MAGHSQFSNIKHRKEAQDQRKSKIFTRIRRELAVAVKEGGDDPSNNPRLRALLALARSENMPKDKIDAVISGVMSGAGDDYDEVHYEGYGHGGVALMVYALSNNRNRTASELRFIFSRNGGSLGESGSVSFMFDRVGLFVFDVEGQSSFDDFFQSVVELGAIDVVEERGRYKVICTLQDFGKLREQFSGKFSGLLESRLSWQAKDYINITDPKLVESLRGLLAALHDNDDVQIVEGNFILPDDEME